VCQCQPIPFERMLLMGPNESPPNSFLHLIC
jgi:hypothetical protein